MGTRIEGHSASMARSPTRASSPIHWGSHGTPRARSHSTMARAAPEAPRPGSPSGPIMLPGTSTRWMPNARTTSGTAEKCASRSCVTTSASTWRTPSAASAGTMRRVPALSLDPPASTSKVVRSDRTSRHAPSPVSTASTRRAPLGGAPACGVAAPCHTSAVSTTTVASAPSRTARGRPTHSATTAASDATTHHSEGRPVHQMDPGTSQDARATQSSDAAQAHAAAPGSSATAALSWPAAMAATPPTVTSAAAGMVSTLIGAAKALANPPCHRAMGVLTVKATRLLMHACANAEAARAIHEPSGPRGAPAAPASVATPARARAAQRSHGACASVSSPSTTP